MKDVILTEATVLPDERGFFFESLHQRRFEEAARQNVTFAQDNHRKLQKALLGLHYRIVQPQGKLVRVTSRETSHVAVDIREDSETLGQWVGAALPAENTTQPSVPEGFAHGFLLLSDHGEVPQKTTDYYYPPSAKYLA